MGQADQCFGRTRDGGRRRRWGTFGNAAVVWGCVGAVGLREARWAVGRGRVVGGGLGCERCVGLRKWVGLWEVRWLRKWVRLRKWVGLREVGWVAGRALAAEGALGCGRWGWVG